MITTDSLGTPVMYTRRCTWNLSLL